MTLHDLASGFEKFPQTLVNVRFENADSDPLNSDEVLTAKAEAVSVLGKQGRVLLRKSGTEPLIRVMVESDDELASTTWAEKIADAVRNVSS